MTTFQSEFSNLIKYLENKEARRQVHLGHKEQGCNLGCQRGKHLRKNNSIRIRKISANQFCKVNFKESSGEEMETQTCCQSSSTDEEGQKKPVSWIYCSS